MSIDQQILFLIGALGAINGIVLAVFLLAAKKASPAAKLLGILLLVLSIRVIKSVFFYFNPQLPKVYLQIGLSACFLVGPSLYYFFKASLQQTAKLPAAWKWHWAILLGIVVLGGIAVPYQRFPGAWNGVVVYIIYLQWLCYLLAAGSELRTVMNAFITNRATLNTTQQFWLLVYAGNLVVFTAYLLALFGVIKGMYISSAVSFSFIVYLSLFFYLHGSKIDQLLNAEPRTAKRKIAEEDASLWLAKLEKLMLDKALYKDPNLKLPTLAQQIHIPAHLLSQLLNNNLGKSFSAYINEFRINEACKLISANGRLSLEAIGYEVGYNSKSTFYTAFKKIKDTTPALFKESTAKTGA